MKHNSFLDRVEKQKQEAMVYTHRFTRQIMIDCTLIALNKEYGFGAERLKRFVATLLSIYAEYADLWNSDTADTEYARAKLDARLKQICGEYFQPWEERYGGLM